MRKHFFFIIFIFFTSGLSAQELPLTNHSFINPYAYNAAFAGYENRPAIYAGYRNQWAGIEGAPTTAYANFHGVAANVIPYGVNVYSDKRSILSTTYALLTAGFRARIEEDEHYLSFALSGGMGFNSVDFSELNSTTVSSDPVLANALENNSFLDGNAGLVYHNKGFNLGVSLPRIFSNKPIDSLTFRRAEFSPISTSIFMTGYKWKVSQDNFAIEPWVLYYYFEDRDGQFEANTTFHIKDVIWIGGSYRMDYGAAAFLGLNIKDNFKLGYTYEFGISPADNVSFNTHEFTLGVIFGKSAKDKKTSFYQRRRKMLTTMRRNKNEQEEEKQPSQNLYKADKDPFEREQKEPEPEKQEPEPQPEPAPEPEPEPEEEKNELEDENGEIDLDKFLEGFEEEEQVEEDTVEEQPQRAKEPTPERVSEPEKEEETFEGLDAFDASATDEVTTRDEEGIYIGPKIVEKGDHLLELEKGYYVVVGTFNSYRDAEEYSDELFVQSFYTKFGYISQTSDYYVYIFHSPDNKQECVDTMERLEQITDFREMWVLTVE